LQLLYSCNWKIVVVSFQENLKKGIALVAKIDKAIGRIKSKPTNFTWNELVKIMLHFGYQQLEGSGSRVKFYHKEKDSLLNIHKPHNPKTLRPYQIEAAITRLERDQFI
jgi:hypothetical protein